jgi:hypothetical protein
MNGWRNGDPKARRTADGYDLALPADGCGEPMALADSIAPSAVKPWDPQRRLPSLLRSAVNLRSLADQHWKEARLHVHAARMARMNGDASSLLACLAEARQARHKAIKCDSFARLCEGRAATLANLLRMSPRSAALH